MAFQKYGQHDQSYIADSVEDLDTLPRCGMGSTCYIIETAEKYMVNSKGQWILQMSYRNDGNNSGGGNTGGGSTPNLSAYATIAYSDAEDAKLKTYVDEQDANTLANTDEYIAELIESGNTDLLSALESHTNKVIAEAETGSTWDEIPTI